MMFTRPVSRHTAAAALLLAAAIATAATHSPPPPCPVSCAYNHHFNGCGVMSHLPNGSTAFLCPPSVVFSAGFDSDMVLQRNSITAVYGQLLSTSSATARVEVTVTDEKGQSYTSGAAQLSEAQNYCLRAAGTHACPAEGAVECCVANYTAAWKAYLRPAPAGRRYTITAHCTEGCTGDRDRDRTTLERVTMGDVYFCSGQSNMALFGEVSYSAKTLQAQMQRGRYANIHYFQFEDMSGGRIGAGGSYTPLWTRQTGASSFNGSTWFNGSYGASFPELGPHNRGPFLKFSAACMEFGRNLVDMLEDQGERVPIGLMQSAIGGTTIEAWSPNETTASCQNTTVGAPSAGPPNGRLFYGMVCPFVNMSIAGYVWYQGENNMHGDTGSSLFGGGYGCMMPKMIAAWRALWSLHLGTSNVLAPFGVVTIAPSGSEGADYHLSAFRWSQTANYGVLPNPAMPATYLAQAYDLNDPWAGHNSPFDRTTTSVCSMNASIPNSCAWTNNGTEQSPPCCHCDTPFASSRCVWNISLWNRDLAPLAPLIKNSSATPTFMGSLHPRLKEPVGRRLAAALVALKHGGNGTVTGPTISGCTYDQPNQRITLHFNKTLLKNDVVAITRTQTPIPPLPPIDPKVKDLPKRPGPVKDSSLTQVCTGDADDCSCLSWKDISKHEKGQPPITGWLCEVPFGGSRPRPAQPTRGDVWAEAPIALLPGSTAVAVDTGALNMTGGGVRAVKFGWSFNAGTCCIDLLTLEGLSPCIPGSCGVMTRDSLLPLNPFFAVVQTSGKCKCPPPQTCDE